MAFSTLLPLARRHLLLPGGRFLLGVTPKRLYATQQTPKADEEEQPVEEKKGFFGRMKAAVGNTVQNVQFKQFLKAFEKELTFEGKLLEFLPVERFPPLSRPRC